MVDAAQRWYILLASLVHVQFTCYKTSIKSTLEKDVKAYGVSRGELVVTPARCDNQILLVSCIVVTRANAFYSHARFTSMPSVSMLYHNAMCY